MPETKIRLWPLYILGIADILSILYTWNFYDTIRQYKIITTIVTQIILILLVLTWLLLLSEIAWKKRRNYFLLSVGVIVIFLSLFKISGFSGDLLPTITFRWQNQDLPSLKQTDNLVNKDSTLFHRNFEQYLGENRNALVTGVKLDTNWHVNPPKILWKQKIGEGSSSFAVKEHYAITQEQRGELEIVVCYQLTTGKMLWQHADKAKLEYDVALGGHGPRATPTIDESRVYTIGVTGILNCLALNTGTRYWARNIVEENNADILDWGYSCSPLIVDSLLIASVGGTNGNSVIAYHKYDGHVIWQSGNDRRSYSSPQLSEILGTTQILVFTDKNIVAYSPQNGERFWEFFWRGGKTQKVAQPVVIDGRYVLGSTSYGVGSKLIEIIKIDDSYSTKILWESNRMKAKFTNVVHKDGYIYGLDDGILACMDIKNGKRVWKKGRYGHGQLLLVDDILLITTERGELALVKAKSNSFMELAVTKAIDGKTWNTPAFPAPYLLVRNSEEAACLELPILALMEEIDGQN